MTFTDWPLSRVLWLVLATTWIIAAAVAYAVSGGGITTYVPLNASRAAVLLGEDKRPLAILAGNNLFLSSERVTFVPQRELEVRLEQLRGSSEKPK